MLFPALISKATQGRNETCWKGILQALCHSRERAVSRRCQGKEASGDVAWTTVCCCAVSPPTAPGCGCKSGYELMR
ncbi:hypothetical protein C4K37_3331 [Pseudomonas chlororaphis subsp. piscium]|nr:hypothetical protein C4K37_3331 [Pseudomonas chlororaphis subsp. piscium]AZC44266.1 hypothetical protein C4K36_3341 [Pseudomonas chlororaphis subsp. piscium]AZC50926.1 hypothetical protein C4K35_3343 [Pseudomonas chlororaphis subsp. piscium]AZC57498.1 hypothetical protein C4K34_3333 [Pseudomonas chlororaphis subsp. piscium]AZC76204.1 hypothetical protein C4K31_3301 [Pseudomonas chlororaphis subsp. piscium]